MSKLIHTVVAVLGVVVLGTTAGEADARDRRSSEGRSGSFTRSPHRQHSFRSHTRFFRGRDHRHFSHRYWHRGWRTHFFWHRGTRQWYYWSRFGGGCYYPLSTVVLIPPGDMPPPGALTLPDQLPPGVTPPPTAPTPAPPPAPPEGNE
jgi:hypothetical protein